MDQFSQLRRDAHHGGWVLMCHQPEREQLLAIARQNWNFETNDARVTLKYQAYILYGRQVTSGWQ